MKLIKEGTKVKIKSGICRGYEGIVESFDEYYYRVKISDKIYVFTKRELKPYD